MRNFNQLASAFHRMNRRKGWAVGSHLRGDRFCGGGQSSTRGIRTVRSEIGPYRRSAGRYLAIAHAHMREEVPCTSRRTSGSCKPWLNAPVPPFPLAIFADGFQEILLAK